MELHSNQIEMFDVAQSCHCHFQNEATKKRGKIEQSPKSTRNGRLRGKKPERKEVKEES